MTTTQDQQTAHRYDWELRWKNGLVPYLGDHGQCASESNARQAAHRALCQLRPGIEGAVTINRVNLATGDKTTVSFAERTNEGGISWYSVTRP